MTDGRRLTEGANFGRAVDRHQPMPSSKTCATASPPPRRRRRSPRPCRWSRRRSCAARRWRPRRRGPMPSAWTRCSATSRPPSPGSTSAPRLLRGTGSDQRASAGRLHRRARPVRPVQLGDRAARARARQCADGRGQGGQVLLRRPQGLRAARARLYEQQIIELIELRSVRTLRFENAEVIAEKIIALFDKGEFDVCTLFFSRFRSVIAQIPTAQQIIPPVFEANGRRSAGRRGLRVRAGRRGHPRRAAAAQHRGADFPRAAGERRVVLRRADERDGQRHPQCRRDDPQADAAATTAPARR